MRRSHNAPPLRFRILKTAAEVFAEKGYHGASMRDIASKLQCTPAALYYHAKNKEDLLFKIAYEAFHQVLSPLKQPSFQNLPPLEQLRFLIHNHLHHFAQNLALMKVLAHDGQYLEGEHFNIIQNMKREYVQLVEDILRKMNPENIIIPQESVRWGALALFGMLNWIYTWFKPEDIENIELYAEHVFFTFLDGWYRLPQNRKHFMKDMTHPSTLLIVPDEKKLPGEKKK